MSSNNTVIKKFFLAAIFYVNALFLVFTTSIVTGCKKLIGVDAPVTSTNADNVYNSDATAAAVLTGVYTTIINKNFSTGGLSSMSIFPSLSADELTLYSGVSSVYYNQYYKNQLSNAIDLGADFWYQTYPYIFTANSAIEGINKSNTLTPAVKQQLLGEAKFIRAFCYFYLVNLYGDIPLALTSDWKINSLLSRTPKAQVYQQIIADLKDAQGLLNDKYLKNDAITPYASGSEERVRPTKWAAAALLARTYLYTFEFTKAEAQATLVINNNSLYDTVSLNKVFLKNSKEAIWQWQPVNTGQNTQDGALFILPASGPSASTSNPVYLSNNLLNSFEATDLRKSNWLNSTTIGTNTYYFPFKYKVGTLNNPVTEYVMVLRLAEQYLIRAEARAQQNNIAGAIADLDVIRKRAGLPLIANTNPNISQSALLTVILHERQVELFTEWGHRWLDLKRTNNIDAVMTAIAPMKGTTWNTNSKLYPIPSSELLSNPNLVQNTGY